MEIKTINISLVYLAIFAVMLILSALINNIFLKFARTLGIRKNQGVQIRWSPTAKPALGGISFFVVFLLTFVCLEIFSSKTHAYLADTKLLGVLAVVTLAFIMGLADDAFDTKPLIKFLAQFICGLILIFTGTKINCFPTDAWNYVFTVFWIVAIMNSINMLDNMDGITTIVAITIHIFVISLNPPIGSIFSANAFLSVGLMGALCGFLIHNWHPSKMFMGDTGSQLLGIFLGIIGIEYAWNSNLDICPNPCWLSTIKGFLIIANVFIIPICDTTTVVINRVFSGKSPFIGGKDHTTHHLFFSGVSERRIAALYILIQLVGIILAYQAILETDWTWKKSGIYVIYPTLVFSFLFGITHQKKKK